RDVYMWGILVLKEHHEPEPAEAHDLRHQDPRSVHDQYRAESALSQYHPFFRRSANFAPTNEKTSSPCWLVPVLRATIRPQPGWRVVSRNSVTSRAKLMVSPA